MKSKSFWSMFLALASTAGLSLWLEPLSPAASAYAPKVGRCVNPRGTGGCYSGIQAAIDASSYGDSINVQAGTYVERIQMANGGSIYGAGWDKTIINGNDAYQPTVSIRWDTGATTVLSGVQVARIECQAARKPGVLAAD